MKTEHPKLSLAARYAKWSMRKVKGKKLNLNTYGTCKLASAVSLLPALMYLGLGMWDKKALHIVLAVVWFAISSLWFVRAGFFELIQKEYTKKQLEPGNREVRETPSKI